MNPQHSYPDHFFRSVLEGNDAALPLRIEEQLRKLYPGNAILACESLDLEDYVALGLASSEVSESPTPALSYFWGGLDHDALYPSYSQVLWNVSWQEHRMQVLQISWQTSCGGQTKYWVMAQEPTIAEAFMLDVHRKTNDPGESILVFKDGHWERSKEMFELVHNSRMSELVLPPERRKSMIDDFKRFLASQDQYLALGVSWRRGAILLGPPGNGKTHFLRALVQELEVPCLYVQSLDHNYYRSEQLLQRVFERARELRPCVLIFEDLDALIDHSNRSFFLNQLDGFERNHGLIVIATTNHPENIDTAIMDRPSRFDRKYEFPLPDSSQRARFLEIWKDKLHTQGGLKGGWDGSNISKIAQATEGFSFAYMKELIVSSLLIWIHQESQNSKRCDFGQLLEDQTRVLQEQRSSVG
jgi:AAA+ superfamily predicted ATPase